MSIQISLKTVGLNMTANIKDAALAAVLSLIQEHRDDTTPAPAPAAAAPSSGVLASGATLEGEDTIKSALRERGAGELLNHFKWESYPEKILLLGSWFEAKGGTTPWRSADMEEVFAQAKEKSPGNFPRDIKIAIKSGWVNAVTPRTYSLTRTGWNKIAQALSGSTPTT